MAQSHIRMEPMMKNVRFLGLNVHAQTIAVAIAEVGEKYAARRILVPTTRKAHTAGCANLVRGSSG